MRDFTIVVLDDDPTGTQTVHNVDVYTDWSTESIKSGFASPDRLFFILTNSRAFDEKTTEEVHRDIAQKIFEQAKLQKKDFIVISRGDSTLRGHYPIETACMQDVFKENGLPMDGEIVIPFFPEGGRITIDDVHYVRQGENLIPAAETEFARDKTFGYKNSNLKNWIEEKTSGEYKAADVLSISLELLNAKDYARITEILCNCKNFSKVIVNATEYEHIRVFAKAFFDAMAGGKRFIFRSAAAMVKVLGDISDKPLLTTAQLKDAQNPNGGLIIAGSHVAKTTAQLCALRKGSNVEFIELNQHLAIDDAAFDTEVKRVLALTNKSILSGKDTVVMTRRERFDLGTDKESELKLAVKISDGLSDIVRLLSTRPSFVVSKGGITSSDTAVKGLGIKKAKVAGQILPGVPVWQAGDDSKYPGLMLVIFPGNVGDEDALLKVVQ